MMNNAIFRDAEGASWQIDIVYGDILRVKQHVQDAEGKPLDLCYIAETGDFTAVSNHINIVVQCVYWLLYPAIADYSGKTGIEAQEWFYNRLNAAAIIELTQAWYEAIVNFTPFPVVRSAMTIAGRKRTEAELITAIETLAGQLEDCTNMPESSASIPANTPTVSSV